MFCIFFSIILGVSLVTCNPSCPQLKDGMINVHFVCHTHDDVGWLKTVDQYYYGSEKDITWVGVQYILDSVVESLKKDTRRKFIFVESAFFFRWWEEQTDETKEEVKELVESGQLEFVGGGWSMNDEACPVYYDIADQMSIGISKLKETFGQAGVPRIAWQIDPFGHTYTQAILFAEMGFDGIFLGRIDHADIENRFRNKEMEMIWSPQGAYEHYDSKEIFTGILPNRYSPPEGLCFDLTCRDDPIMDNKNLEDYNVDKMVDLFLQRVDEQSQGYATTNLIMTMGDDFNYVYAEMWFKNLDKLIKYVNARQANGSNVNAMYSTPSCYLDALNAANKTWTVKKDDFIPYSSDSHSYWTGYYTSRPAHKFFIRYAYPYLQSAKQLALFTGEHFADKLTYTMGLVQHHDAITGTARQKVSDDYDKRISEGLDSTQKFLSQAFRNLTEDSDRNFEFCNRLNISECAFTENIRNSEFIVTVYNPHSKYQRKLVQMPIQNCEQDLQVRNKKGEKMMLQISTIPPFVKNIPGRNSTAECDAYFLTDDLPPLTATEYYVFASDVEESWQLATRMNPGNGEYSIYDNYKEGAQVVFQKPNIIKVKQNNKDIVKVLLQDLIYHGKPGNNSEPEYRASGAYIFRPDGEPVLVDNYNCSSMFNGHVFYEVWCTSEKYPWISVIYRFMKEFTNTSKNLNFEYEWIVGPIPIEDGIGKEIIRKFKIVNDGDLKWNTGEYFYTDSNGRYFLKRQRNYRDTWNFTSTEPISQNYYPVNTGIAIKNESGEMGIGVLNDRSQGGTSAKSNEIELMTHRRLLYDDAFGVSEPLNETAYGEGLVVKGKHTLFFNIGEGPFTDVFDSMGKKAQEQQFAPITAFSLVQSKQNKSWRKEAKILLKNLPENIHILSLEPWSNDRVLLRLEHSNFNIKKRRLQLQSSLVSSVNLKTLFEGWEVLNIEEVTLATGHVKKKKTNLVWNQSPQHIDEQTERLEERYSIYMFKPLQIRSFLLRIKRN